jgi:cytochrome c553
MNLRIALLSLGVLTLSAGIAPAQTPRTGRLMREKLAHSQKILEGLTTSNQDLLVREADALSRIATSPQWAADLRTPELRGYAESFIKTVTDLAAAARRRDLDAAAANYNTMVTACYQCHKHLKNSRIAR